MWARRVIVGASLAVASLAVVPGIAGADPASNCVSAGSVTTPNDCVTTPTVSGKATDPVVPASSGSNVVKTASTTSSLPFTGADVAELAVVGTGAVLAGSVLMRRRRRVVA